MRIAFILTQSLDSPSGLGRYSPLAKELAHLGHPVDLLALHYDWGNLRSKKFQSGNLHVSYVGQMHVKKAGPRKTYFSPGRLLLVSLASSLRLAAALWRSQAQVIHLCKPQPINTLAVRLASRGRPIFVDCDDYEAETNLFQTAWQRKIVRWFEDGIVSYARGITTNTHFTLQRYQALGFPASRMVYVPNGVDRERFSTPVNTAPLLDKYGLALNQPVILYVGTLGLLSHPVDLLLEAFQRILPRLPDARLLMVGGGEDYDKIIQLARDLGIYQQTVFAGRVNPEEVQNYYALAAVSVDPIKDDLIARARYPLKVLESLTMGVPVITSAVGDREQLLEHGKLGVLVKPGDSQDLADGLLALLENPEHRLEMAQAAWSHREHRYWDRIVHRFTQIYAMAGLNV